MKTALLCAGAWAAAIGALHAWLNLDLGSKTVTAERTFKVGFLPVT
ncbi:MAG TPA: hypothetical protein VK348_13420 [Planctomycetota bacterium]|nr:hypothetical protein [Planctomycetota bacterium]